MTERQEANLPAPIGLRAEIDALTYEGPESIADAKTVREKLSALAEVAKRAGADETEYRRLARIAERALGQMLAVARERGDLAEVGGDRRSESTSPTLNDLGIERGLASDASVFAELPDDVWEEAVADAPSRAALGRAGRSFLDDVAEARRTREEREQAYKREAARIEEELKRLQDRPTAE